MTFDAEKVNLNITRHLYESDLDAPRRETELSTSFEHWWTKTSLLQAYGRYCMNPRCKMAKAQVNGLELTQIEVQIDSLRDRMKLSNYQLICRNCKKSKLIYNNQQDCRPEGWSHIIENVKPLILDRSYGATLRQLSLLQLRAELKERSIYCNLTDRELIKEVDLAAIIGNIDYRLINNFSKQQVDKNDFIRRSSIYERYYKLLMMPDSQLRQIYPDIEGICHKVFKLNLKSVNRKRLANHTF